MSKIKKTIVKTPILCQTILKCLNHLVTRELLILSSLLSFTVFLVLLVANYAKSLNDQVAIGGLFFTLSFSIWQFIEDRKEKNLRNSLSIEESINERVDFIVNQFTKALDDIKNRSEKEDDIHNNKLDLIENKICNITNELTNIKDQLTYHLNSFGHTKTIEQKHEMIKKISRLETIIEVGNSYTTLSETVAQLADKITVLENKK